MTFLSMISIFLLNFCIENLVCTTASADFPKLIRDCGGILSRGIYSWHFALGTYNDLIHVPIIILRD